MWSNIWETIQKCAMLNSRANTHTQGVQTCNLREQQYNNAAVTIANTKTNTNANVMERSL